MENWHLAKTELKTDEELEFDETIVKENQLKDIAMEIVEDPYATDDSLSVSDQIKAISKNYRLHSEFVKEQEHRSQQTMDELLRDNPLARKAYSRTYNIPEEDVMDTSYYDMTSQIDEFYGDNSKNKISKLQEQFNNINDLR